MSPFPDYRKATNAAYELLIKRRKISLATNVIAIVEELLHDCKIINYGQACFLYGYERETITAVSEYGFSIIDSYNRRIILYNEDAPAGCSRFTIAHEIGHAVLGHKSEDDSNSEKEANCFARNLLCPIPIVVGLDVDTVEDYVSVFNVTERMATVALDKRNTDKYYISDENSDIIFDMLEAYMQDFNTLDEFYQHLAS